MTERVYQIACGEQGRRYDDLFLKHDVMFLGPGDPGPYDPARYENCAEYRKLNGKPTEVRRFAKETAEGDLVLLRAGYRVLSIGVVGEYEWLPSFDDVYGWDLQNTRRVVWQRHLDAELESIQADGDLFRSRKQIPTYTAVRDEKILDPIRPLLTNLRTRELQPMPTVPVPLSLDQFCEHLFRRGLGVAALGVLRQTLDKQQSLLRWYQSTASPNRPSEHEIVAHVILPLLIAVGWSEQLLGVEWKRVDLAVFSGTPTDESTCRMICEAKGMGRGLQDDVHQARRYCRDLGLAACKRLLVADGGRFYVYDRNGDAWPEKPTGYMNVLKLRAAHLCPENTSALETLMKLTPMQVGLG